MGKKPTEKKQPMVFTSKFFYYEDLVEQIYDPKYKAVSFIRYAKADKELVRDPKYDWNNILYLPIRDDLLDKGAVLLPNDAIDYGTELELEKELHDFIITWLDVSEDHLQKAVWYILLSWVIDNLHTIPYLRCLGDYGTGKTRYLDVIGGLCYKPMFVGGAVRSAPIYRVIDLWRGTAIFDEFTLGKSDETEDIIQILNNGFQRGKPVLRCDSGNYEKVKAFDPFGAKILATRSSFKDRALESRCITEIMQVTTKRNIPVDYSDEFFSKRQELQNKLLMYRFKNIDKIKMDKTITIDFGNIIPRIKQSLFPFTVLFQHDKDRLHKFIQYTKEYNNKIIEENSTSFDGQIVNAYFELIEQRNMSEALDDYGTPEITASDVKDFLCANDGWNSDTLKASTIGRHLKSLGFENHARKIGGHTKKILCADENLLNALRLRYIVTVVTEVTADTEQVCL